MNHDNRYRRRDVINSSTARLYPWRLFLTLTSLYNLTQPRLDRPENFSNASPTASRTMYTYTSHTLRRHYHTSSNRPARRQMLFSYWITHPSPHTRRLSRRARPTLGARTHTADLRRSLTEWEMRSGLRPPSLSLYVRSQRMCLDCICRRRY
jgi:hypothetical protein